MEKDRLDSSRINLQSLFKALDGVFQVLDAQAIGDTSLVTSVFRIYIETGGGSYHNSLVVVVEVGEQPFAELVAVVNGEFHHGVEGAFGVGAEAARNLVDALDDDIAAGHIFLSDSVEILLRSVNGSFAEDLTE